MRPLSAKSLSGKTARVLTFVPAEWTDELTVRHNIRDVTGFNALSIGQCLKWLITIGVIERRGQRGPGSQVRRTPEAA